MVATICMNHLRRAIYPTATDNRYTNDRQLYRLVVHRMIIPNSSWKTHPVSTGSGAIVMSTANIDGSRHAYTFPVFCIPKVFY